MSQTPTLGCRRKRHLGSTDRPGSGWPKVEEDNIEPIPSKWHRALSAEVPTQVTLALSASRHSLSDCRTPESSSMTNADQAESIITLSRTEWLHIFYYTLQRIAA